MKIYLLLIVLFFSSYLYSQEKKDYGQIHGNFEINMQTYKEDSLIGAPDVPEIMRANAYANINYTKDKFSAGIRYEAYLNTLLGYSEEYNGQGIAYKYASYTADELEVTVGNFYEQFGAGLVLRTYEDKTLGYDNALDGIRLRYKPVDGIKLTGLLGKQKKYFENGTGIIRGFDTEISVNNLFEKLSEKKTKFSLGGSFVSKYQENLNPKYNLPENVGAFSGRFSVARRGFKLSSEFVHKINDPSSDNNLIFKDGNALLINTSWSKKGIGFLLSILRLDNMSFRSDRYATINDLHINYLPAIAKTHAYAFAAMYPFATQPNGQAGINAEIFYKFKRNSALGGKYGTSLSINFSQVNSIKTEPVYSTDDAVNLDGYSSDFFSIGDSLYFRDFNIELYKKISRSFKFSLVYMLESYNKDVIQGLSDYGIVKSNIGIIDMTYKLTSKHALRFEGEILLTEQDNGNWGMVMLEYTYSPHWFVAVYDQYNYGNPSDDYKIHYFNITAGYTKGANRIQIGYGKQREGILCVGGVCRNVPASNGFTLSISSSF
jgi:hypothetical protein